MKTKNENIYYFPRNDETWLSSMITYHGAIYIKAGSRISQLLLDHVGCPLLL